MPALINKSNELIAGYSLQERIGSGGYGEVWRAEAPGGLMKAIKLIYGRFDEARASCELKALHRIKEVRHPFLLSLERIEVIDGQLVIVTELADCSLHDRFEACRAAGMPGIPRDELLLYLHDAADALDYMSEHFLLQHLDIKPENLLVVGGRVKVADFGLVKDIQDVTVSLMGGLTPVYAAPEVFEGHPSLQSDQYSLAIVYQEMLNGSLPFPGKTPAQLTSQHLHGNPHLTSLPRGDQTILARALDKDPQNRFPSCRELVETLKGAASSESVAVSLPPEAEPTREAYRTITLSNAEPNCDTEAKGRGKELSQNSASSSAVADEVHNIARFGENEQIFLDEKIRETFTKINALEQRSVAEVLVEPPPAEFENLPAWEQPFTEAKLRPTLVIGVGGTAGRVLQELQHRWQERFDNMGEVPIFQSLLLDTDSQNVDKISTAPDPATRLIYAELLPLKKPEDYRENSDRLMRWLGHRWIYNIPRSLRTEGLRPLGRLALVDNAKQVNSRLRKILKTITATESGEASARQTKMPMGEASPLIYIIASTSGGTGSGMVLDVAFAVRQALAQEGIATARICGMLLHGTSRHAAEKTLAIANTYACLSELNAYQRRYPGEGAWGMPAKEKGISPFDDTYFVHLGDDLSEGQLDAAAEKIANYLDLDTTTACREFFERCRHSKAAAELPLRDWSLRSMGLCRLGFTPDDIPAADIETLCQILVDVWRQSRQDNSPRTDTTEVAQPELKTLFDFEGLCGKVEELVHEQVHASDENTLQETLEKTYQIFAPTEEQAATADRAKKTLDTLFATVRSLTEKDYDSTVGTDEPVLLSLRKLAATESEVMRAVLLKMLDRAENGLPSLQKTIDEVLLELRDKEREACQRMERLRKVIGKAELLLPQATPEKKSWLGRLFGKGTEKHAEGCWNEYALWRLELVVLHGQRYLWHALHASLTVLKEELREMRQALQAVSEEFLRGEPQVESSEAEGSWAFRSLLKNAWEELLHKHRRPLVGKLEPRLRRTIVAEYISVDGTATPKDPTARAKAESLRRSVRQELCRLLQEIDLASLMLSSDPSAENKDSPVSKILEQSQAAQYANFGGAQRLLLTCPAGMVVENIKQKIDSAAQATCSVARTSSGEVVLCYEVERIPPLRIAAQLLEHHRECREIATKLHSRIDVSWPHDF